MILIVQPSTLKTKRFMVTFRKPDGTEKIYHFGYKNGHSHGLTYIDGATEAQRDAYRARHRANAIERQLIDNLIPSPALFSYALLWGDSRDISRNVTKLNNLWRK